jgi:dsDNA-specific endonuclease/ATPase MutS2
MMEVIKEALRSPVGSFSFVLGIMLLGGWAIHYITKFTTKINVEHGQFSKRMDKVESNVDEIRKDIAYIKGSLELVVASKDALSKKKSPLSFTDLGKEIAKSNDLDAMIANNWLKINTVLQDLKTKNPYDIQEFCLETAFVEPEKFFSPNDFDKLKSVSYKTGNTLISITRLMGILIRDRYFNENGIDADDVDLKQ